MGFIKETHLKCDFGLSTGCDESWGVDDMAMGHTAQKLRQDAKSSHSWGRSGGKDICGPCKAALTGGGKDGD